MAESAPLSSPGPYHADGLVLLRPHVGPNCFWRSAIDGPEYAPTPIFVIEPSRRLSVDASANPSLALPSSAPHPGTQIPPGSALMGLGQIINILRRRQTLILSIIGGVLALTALVIFSETPIYQAQATLRMDVPVSADGSDRTQPSAENEMQIETEIRALGSHALAAAMVRELDLLDNPAFSGRKMSSGRTDRASQGRIDKAADQLLSMVAVQRVPHTPLITVTVYSPYPKFAALIANRYVTVRQMNSLTDRMQRQDRIVAAMADRTRRAGADLQHAEQAVADYRSQNRMLAGAGGTNDLAGITALAAETVSAASARAAAAAKAAGVSAAARMRPGPESATSPLLQAQQQRYAELMQRKAELSTFYGARHPALANVLAQLEEVQQHIAAEQQRVRERAAADAAVEASHESFLAQSDAQGAAAREAVLQSSLGAMTSKAYQNNEANVKLAELERTAEVQRGLYVALSTRLKQLNTALITGTGLVLESNAPIPQDPIRPTPGKTMMAALMGSAILAFGCAFVLELTDRRLRSAEQIWRLFGLDSFAMVPLLTSNVTKTTASELIEARPSSLFAESAQMLHTEVMRQKRGGGAQVVLVTSPLPGDGKTSVAHSLAAAAVAAGKKAAVVELDLWRPSPPPVNIEQSVDLISYLKGEAPARALLSHAAARPSSALLVFAAHERARDPASMISSSQLAALFEDLRARMDLVVIDAPPVLAVRDASNMASFADMSLLVVRWGRTTIEEAADALVALRAPVDGVVINAVDYARHSYGRYGDLVQYYDRAGAYYAHDDDLIQRGVMGRLRQKLRFRRMAGAEAA